MLLYKYYSFNEHSLSTLINKELWASHPSKFNDPFDSAFSVFINEGNESMAIANYKNKKAICCFSADHTNILMWSHYANSHTGFCVGFDKSKLEEKHGKLFEEVSYTKKFPIFDIKEFLTEESDSSGKIRAKTRVELFTIKYEDWHYEKEWRLILELDPDNYKDETWNGKTIKIPDGCIQSVYFGSKMSPKNIRTIKNIFNDDRVLCKKMIKDSNSFALIETSC